MLSVHLWFLSQFLDQVFCHQNFTIDIWLWFWWSVQQWSSEALLCSLVEKQVCWLDTLRLWPMPGYTFELQVYLICIWYAVQQWSSEAQCTTVQFGWETGLLVGHPDTLSLWHSDQCQGIHLNFKSAYLAFCNAPAFFEGFPVYLSNGNHKKKLWIYLNG